MFSIKSCIVINYFLSYSIFSAKIIWDNSVEIDFNEIDMFGRSDEVRLPNRFLIFPGTKWCGPGNIAYNYSDLGTEADTDMCCRTHDTCDDIIEGYGEKYGLSNPGFYTRLNCYCDNEFYRCLKNVSSYSASKVGHLYFTVLITQCFMKEYPIIGCDKYTYFPLRKCLVYNLDAQQPKEYQWFDLPNY